MTRLEVIIKVIRAKGYVVVVEVATKDELDWVMKSIIASQPNPPPPQSRE